MFESKDYSKRKTRRRIIAEAVAKVKED